MIPEYPPIPNESSFFEDEWTKDEYEIYLCLVEMEEMDELLS